MRRLLFAAGLLLASAPAGAWEFIQGGYICHPGLSHGRGPYNACTDVAWREASGAVRLDGWYKSAGALLLGSPKACIADPDSQFLFHGSGALETPAFTTLSGAELIARFGVPACGDRRAEARR